MKDFARNMVMQNTILENEEMILILLQANPEIADIIIGHDDNNNGSGVINTPATVGNSAQKTPERPIKNMAALLAQLKQY